MAEHLFALTKLKAGFLPWEPLSCSLLVTFWELELAKFGCEAFDPAQVGTNLPYTHHVCAHVELVEKGQLRPVCGLSW